jgi:hypothetical protein
MTVLDDYVIRHVNNCSTFDQEAAIIELVDLRSENIRIKKVVDDVFGENMEFAKLIARLQSCEDCLTDMVQQYCHNTNDPPELYSHNFMSAGERTFDYLASNGLAKYSPNGIDIYFDKEKE